MEAGAGESRTSDDTRYEFGANWSQYVRSHFSEERMRLARERLLGFLGLQTLEGKTFLDIGCGSGLHALAAWAAGAERVHAFDDDPTSVSTTQQLHAKVGAPENWKTEQGSVLDPDYMAALEKADIVYSWGVLHHTGDMWNAIRQAASAMKEDGVFFIALYCTDVFDTGANGSAGLSGNPSIASWARVKQAYNRAGKWKRRSMEWQYALQRTIWPDLRQGRNPLKTIWGQGQGRGMEYWTDVRDWLGGWPIEYARIAETKAFARQELGLELINIKAGEACTEYLFRKQGARNDWDDYLQTLPAPQPLPAPYAHVDGFCYRANLKEGEASCDTMEQPKRSRLMLLEDEVPIGFSHAVHGDIIAFGGGRYSHWSDYFLFSASDNTDPNHNGRRYTYCLEWGR